MGFFAVLADPDESGANYEVERCHVNFWCLRGLFRRCFYWDIGLDIKVGNNPFSRFQLAIPSGTTEGFRDLTSKVQNQAISQMIFGKPVAISDGVLEYERTRYSLAAVGSAKLVKEQSSSSFSLWSLRTAQEQPANSRIYMRVRFGVRSVGRCWQWKRFLFSRCGALVDVRFADVREAWNVAGADALKARIIPIANLNFFVVAPADFHLTATSPSVHYIRILEGRAWEDYLNRKTKVVGTEKLAIYQWRNGARQIKPTDPFRVFLDIDRDLGFASLPNAFLLALALFVVVVAGSLVAADWPEASWGGLNALFDFVRLHVGKVSVVGLLGAIYFILNVSDEFVRRIRWLGPAFDWLERGVFRAKDS